MGSYAAISFYLILIRALVSISNNIIVTINNILGVFKCTAHMQKLAYFHY